MAVTLTSKISLIADFNYGDQAGVQKKSGISNIAQLYTLASGVGANQADKIYAETRTLGPSATVTLDLAGTLVDVFGAVCTFVRVKGIFLFAAAANANNVLIGAAAGTQFLGPLGSATDVVNVRPGGFSCFFAPDATAWPVGAGATDFLKFANSAAGTSVTYDLYIFGASA